MRGVLSWKPDVIKTWFPVHKRNLGERGKGGKGPPPIFFCLRHLFGYWVEEVQIKNLGEGGGKLCIYINPYPANVENMLS
jgi:hypothetical protein